MRYSGEVLQIVTAKEARQILVAANKKRLPLYRKHLTLLVEDAYAIIMENIGYGQYQIKSCYIDKSK